MCNQLVLKTLFLGFSALAFSVTCYLTFLVEEIPVTISSSIDLLVVDRKTHEIIGENATLKYLWRPNVNLIDGLNASADFGFSDRIGSQLEWTKKLFQSSSVDGLPGKNILLVLGKDGGRFWSTDNQIKCPGFEISREKCNLTVFEVKKRRRSLPRGNFDAVIYTQDYKKPAGRRSKLSPQSNAIEIIYTEESPYRLKYQLEGNNLFASYYKGSDIVLPYSKWVPYDSPEAEYFNIQRDKDDNSEENKDYSQNKTNFAVIFVSNCKEVANNRFKYVNELKKFIPVDMFGQCGEVIPNCTNKGSRDCLATTAKKYKFYLAFENSNCRHYITEKFFYNALANDVLPIVLGAHPKDYEEAAPPKSFIHVDDFQSPEELAKYLIALDKNNTLYNEYFKWKGTGTFYHAWSDLFCRLCGLMFYSDFIPAPVRDKVTNWNYKETCLPVGKWYWTRD